MENNYIMLYRDIYYNIARFMNKMDVITILYRVSTSAYGVLEDDDMIKRMSKHKSRTLEAYKDACKIGFSDAVEYFLSKPVEKLNVYIVLGLYIACSNRHIELSEFLADRYRDLDGNPYKEVGITALDLTHTIAKKGSIDCYEKISSSLLYYCGYRGNSEQFYNMIMLYASRYNNVNLLPIFNPKEFKPYRLFSEACLNNSIDTAKYLYEKYREYIPDKSIKQLSHQCNVRKDTCSRTSTWLNSIIHE